MPRAGRYDYPDRDLDSCIEYMRTAYDKIKATAMKRDAFAEALGLSPKTGPFGVLIGSLAKYSLADTRDGYVRYTELAKTILFEPTKSNEAKSEAVRNIKLFADIHARLGAQATDEQIRIFLREHADVDTAEAPEKALDVSKIFKRVAPYFPTTPAAGVNPSVGSGGESKMEESNKTMDDQQSGVKIPSTFGTEKFESTDFGIWVKKDVDSIDFLKNQIDAWLDYVKSKVTKERQQTTVN
jgi:hypothetical protein